MNYKLVCIDMDGTLLNKKHKVTETSRKILKQAHDKGIHIVITTGRTYADAKYYSNLIGVKSPVIASNGAIIKEKDRDEVIYKNVLGENLCLKLIDIFSRYNVFPMFMTPKIIYCANLSTRIFMRFLQFRGIFNKEIECKYVRSKEQWNNIFKNHSDDIIKCEVFGKTEHELVKLRRELETIKKIQMASSSKRNIEINSQGVSKGKAVEILGNIYKIDRENIITIGDSENDLSMIKFAGMGIAMGNAIETVKQAADYITDTNDNDGVAKAVSKFILGSK